MYSTAYRRDEEPRGGTAWQDALPFTTSNEARSYKGFCLRENRACVPGGPAEFPARGASPTPVGHESCSTARGICHPAESATFCARRGSARLRLWGKRGQDEGGVWGCGSPAAAASDALPAAAASAISPAFAQAPAAPAVSVRAEPRQERRALCEEQGWTRRSGVSGYKYRRAPDDRKAGAADTKSGGCCPRALPQPGAETRLLKASSWLRSGQVAWGRGAARNWSEGETLEKSFLAQRTSHESGIGCTPARALRLP